MTLELVLALHEGVSFLEKRGTPYMLIGGLAAGARGAYRSTTDVDLACLVADADADGFATEAASAFEPLKPPQRVAGFRQSGLMRVKAANGVVIDLIKANTPFEERAIERATVENIGGRPVHVASAEDLVIFKCIAGRTRDITDLEGILNRRRTSLDTAYIASWLDAFVEGSGEEAFRQRYLDAWESTRPLEEGD